MRLVWTKSNLPLSVGIRSLLGSDCSHFAIVFDSPGGGLMFESNLIGAHPKFFKTALKDGMEVVHEITLDLSIEDEDAIWDLAVSKFDGRAYDYGAFAYLGWRGLLQRVGIPLPAANVWASQATELCVELFSIVQPYTPLKDAKLDLAMTGPHALYERYMKASQ